MNWKSVWLTSAGVAGGYLAALIIHSPGSVDERIHGASAETSAAPPMGLEFRRGDLQQQVARLPAETEASRNVSAELRLGVGPSREESAELQKKFYALALQQETDRLLAAGFDVNRIQWLRERSKQLEVDRRKIETERRLLGLPGAVDLDYSSGTEDLDLRLEIGDIEYEKYREATGRPNSVAIASLLPGSVAESVGFKPGDQIVRYGGKRTYTYAQIVKMYDKEIAPGTNLQVELLRDGIRRYISVPAGSVGIAAVPPDGRLIKAFTIGPRASGTDPQAALQASP